MHTILATTLFIAIAAAPLGAASVPSRTIYGNYVEARTADVYTGPCFANSEVGSVGQLAVFGWNVGQGSWDGVRLDGLSVVGVVRASHTLGDVAKPAYPVKSILIVDERANPEQRLALQRFAKRMAGELLQQVVKVDYQPITLGFENGDMHTMQATLVAGNLAKIQTRALNDTDHICHNEEVFYPPLAELNHAMPAVTVAHRFDGHRHFFRSLGIGPAPGAGTPLYLTPLADEHYDPVPGRS
jgi:hypothetical protein